MKNLIKSIAIALVCFAFTNVQAKDDKKKTEQVTYKVEMDCQKCVDKISKNIAFEKGVKDIKADFETQTVAITYKADKTNTDNLVAAFKKLGYDAKELKEEGCAEKADKKCCGGH